MLKEPTTNSTKGTIKPAKKKLRLKVILYILLILILLILGASIYFKVKNYLKYNKNDVVVENTHQERADSINSVNSNMLSEFLQKQHEFQQDVYSKINELSAEIKQNKNSITRVDSQKGDPSKVILLEKTPVTTAVIPPTYKKNNNENFAIIYYLIQALNSNHSFISELDAFKITPESRNFNEEISYLQNIASKGITISSDLAISFANLKPNIKVETYQQDKGILGRIKYYLSFILVAQKVNNFKQSESSLDFQLYNIEKLLLDNKPEKALYIVDNNLSNIKVITSWHVDLHYRVMANFFILKLQQLLLNGLHVDN